MANLDTAQKRQSGTHINMAWRCPPLPTGTFNQGERQAAAYMYSGILASPPNPDQDEFRIGGREIIERFQPEKIISAPTVIWPWGMNKKTGGTDGP